MPSELEAVAAEAATCTRCRLHESRTQVVFGQGDPAADLMFVGEAPGFHEDRQGLPFVGPSGQLLNRLLGGIGLRREDVYTCNVVKSRPPGNRDPQPDEIAACRPWLDAQIRLVDPKVVVTLGNFAAKTLLETTTGITRLRGRTHPFQDGCCCRPSIRRRLCTPRAGARPGRARWRRWRATSGSWPSCWPPGRRWTRTGRPSS